MTSLRVGEKMEKVKKNKGMYFVRFSKSFI